jgi:hypothetical protein
MSSADPSKEKPRVISNLDSLNLCATQLVSLVIERLHARSEAFKKSPAPGVSATTIREQSKKFEYVEKLLNNHKSYQRSKNDRHPHSPLHRIIRGFIVEFISQTEEQLTPLNTEHDQNPEARAYWNSKDPKDFDSAKLPGMYHMAVSYNKLRDPLRRESGNLAKLHAVGEVIRASIDVFKEHFPALAPGSEPRASIYNDHIESIRLASTLRTLGSPLRPRLSIE